MHYSKIPCSKTQISGNQPPRYHNHNNKPTKHKNPSKNNKNQITMVKNSKAMIRVEELSIKMPRKHVIK